MRTIHLTIIAALALVVGLHAQDADSLPLTIDINAPIDVPADGGTLTLGGGNLTLGGGNLTIGSGNLTIVGGTLTTTGAGTLVLNGNNTYTGNTTVSGGTLEIGNGGTLLLGNGTLVLGNGSAGTLQLGNGTLGLTKNGTGTLILSGNNTYTGNTTINSGTLQINNGFTLRSTIHIAGGATLTATFANGTAYESLLPPVIRQGGLATTMNLIGGTAGSDRDVSITFADREGAPLASDIVGFTGTSGSGSADTFVLQLTYDKPTANALFGNESTARLGWFDPATSAWKLAVAGNTGGTALFAGNRAYNPITDFALGTYGVDTATNTVWAVSTTTATSASSPRHKCNGTPRPITAPSPSQATPALTSR